MKSWNLKMQAYVLLSLRGSISQPTPKRVADGRKTAKPTQYGSASQPVRAAKPAKALWEEVLQKMKPHFKELRGVQMASVPVLLQVLKVDRSKKQHLCRDLARWKSMHRWTQDDLYESKRKGLNRKAGGSSEAVATEQVLRII